MTLGASGKPSGRLSGAPFNGPTHVAVDWRNGTSTSQTATATPASTSTTPMEGTCCRGGSPAPTRENSTPSTMSPQTRMVGSMWRTVRTIASRCSVPTASSRLNGATSRQPRACTSSAQETSWYTSASSMPASRRIPAAWGTGPDSASDRESASSTRAETWSPGSATSLSAKSQASSSRLTVSPWTPAETSTWRRCPSAHTAHDKTRHERLALSKSWSAGVSSR